MRYSGSSYLGPGQTASGRRADLRGLVLGRVLLGRSRFPAYPFPRSVPQLSVCPALVGSPVVRLPCCIVICRTAASRQPVAAGELSIKFWFPGVMP
eukprot:6540828-Pyramimonas_sp.AAC.1